MTAVTGCVDQAENFTNEYAKSEFNLVKNGAWVVLLFNGLRYFPWLHFKK